jgi:hypothetical protein
MPFVISAIIIICAVYLVHRKFRRRKGGNSDKYDIEVPNEEPLLGTT